MDRPTAAGRTHRCRLAAAAAAVGLGVVGCSAGTDATTIGKRTTSDAAQGEVGPILVRAVSLATPPGRRYAEGSTARLYAYLYNNGTRSDRLVGVTSDAAQSARISRLASGSADPAAQSSTATPAPLPSATPQPTATAGNGSGSGSGAGEVSAVAVPPAGRVDAGPDGAIQIELVGLTRELTYGAFVPVTLRFETAGSLALDVPVSLPGYRGVRPSESAGAEDTE